MTFLYEEKSKEISLEFEIVSQRFLGTIFNDID